jgi:hypothetical protein
MSDSTSPAPHRDPWVDVLRPYVTGSVVSLTTRGLLVERSWLDPRDPRDATIIFTHPASNVSAHKFALVWDEVTGWRTGVFESGQPGVRTELSGTSYLGGGLLPDGDELAGRVLTGAAESRCEHRSVADVRDGLDAALLEHR